jgi:hypothetical protein
MRQYLLLIVKASGSIDRGMVGPRFGQLIGAKGATHNVAKRKGRRHWRLRSPRAQNCSVMKDSASPLVASSQRHRSDPRKHLAEQPIGVI